MIASCVIVTVMLRQGFLLRLDASRTPSPKKHRKLALSPVSTSPLIPSSLCLSLSLARTLARIPAGNHDRNTDQRWPFKKYGRGARATEKSEDGH